MSLDLCASGQGVHGQISFAYTIPLEKLWEQCCDCRWMLRGCCSKLEAQVYVPGHIDFDFQTQTATSELMLPIIASLPIPC